MEAIKSAWRFVILKVWWYARRCSSIVDRECDREWRRSLSRMSMVELKYQFRQLIAVCGERAIAKMHAQGVFIRAKGCLRIVGQRLLKRGSSQLPIVRALMREFSSDLTSLLEDPEENEELLRVAEVEDVEMEVSGEEEAGQGNEVDDDIVILETSASPRPVWRELSQSSILGALLAEQANAADSSTSGDDEYDDDDDDDDDDEVQDLPPSPIFGRRRVAGPSTSRLDEPQPSTSRAEPQYAPSDVVLPTYDDRNQQRTRYPDIGLSHVFGLQTGRGVAVDRRQKDDTDDNDDEEDSDSVTLSAESERVENSEDEQGVSPSLDVLPPGNRFTIIGERKTETRRFALLARELSVKINIPEAEKNPIEWLEGAFKDLYNYVTSACGETAYIGFTFNAESFQVEDI